MTAMKGFFCLKYLDICMFNSNYNSSGRSNYITKPNIYKDSPKPKEEWELLRPVFE